ncbi:hypothetical protein [Nonomuraea gerenzanensis]|uniref:Uncharacterized protein n=1 Tax=Nonomuraea gerenzanensis TaxID=93944 RepID=A0A1M4BL05_9ACTN|nr:hypothetical protein [Nonomuraea gerenzanensis]UBU19194.1 hypothetical protein LCN96_56340 [Nonomuraea gerenzanensis]SAP16357.1 hypothetical protein BN4615_P11020 [Nonomuraea gerenzanensis]
MTETTAAPPPLDPELNDPRKGKSTRIPELSTIEFQSTSALKKWVEESRRLSVNHSAEIEWGAEEIEAVLTITGQGNPWLMGLDVKRRARRIAKRAHRAAELQRGSAAELVKLWQEFLVQFAPALNPQGEQRKKTFDFKS